jgi:acetyl esterase/lipase
MRLNYILEMLRGYSKSSFFFLVVLIAGCSKDDSQVSDAFDPAQAKVLKNESYGSNPLHKADVYLPANRSNTSKTMVLIHGGFWTAGDKSELDTIIGSIKKADPALTIVNMNYRLSDGRSANYFPAQMNDVKLLLNYLQTKASLWHTGTNYALTGISSGGHMALLYAYAFDSEKRIKVVASVLGPTNLADPYYTNNLLFQDLAVSVFGKTWQQDSTLFINASPVRRINASSQPTFLAYGGSDILIPVSNPDSLNIKLEQLKIDHQYFLYPSETHDLSAVAILDIIARMAVFFKSHL